MNNVMQMIDNALDDVRTERQCEQLEIGIRNKNRWRAIETQQAKEERLERRMKLKCNSPSHGDILVNGNSNTIGRFWDSGNFEWGIWLSTTDDKTILDVWRCEITPQYYDRKIKCVEWVWESGFCPEWND